MKIQKIFSMHTVMIGVAAALFMASSAPAQEIENTRWDEGANVVAVQQPARATAANDLKASALNSSASNSAPIAKPMRLIRKRLGDAGLSGRLGGRLL